MGAVFQYVAFDFLWWVLIAFLLVRLLKRDDPRGWLGVGAVIGIGMLTKYTMAVFAVSIAGGVLLTSTRRHLRSPWLWAASRFAAHFPAQSDLAGATRFHLA